jgi:hypothetical protein
MDLQLILDKLEKFYDRFDHGYGTYSEERVKQRAEYHEFRRKTDYLSLEEFNNFKSDYAGKKLTGFIKFRPDNQPEGYYKIRLWGKIANPVVNYQAYLPTSVYFLYQLKQTLRFSVGAITGAGFEFSVSGIIIGILMTILLFIAAISIRLPFAFIFTLIQFFASKTGTPQ